MGLVGFALLAFSSTGERRSIPEISPFPYESVRWHAKNTQDAEVPGLVAKADSDDNAA